MLSVASGLYPTGYKSGTLGHRPGPRDLGPPEPAGPGRGWTRKAVRDEMRVPARDLRHAIPHVYAGDRELHDSALAAGRPPSTAPQPAAPACPPRGRTAARPRSRHSLPVRHPPGPRGGAALPRWPRGLQPDRRHARLGPGRPADRGQGPAAWAALP